eukprot:TRINITY_DN355_c0_g2_i1.p1 TRINITY_DN355_c0_g2~~TRINITY_DN355_c0_g2_i1.p1  ORF type:complete len:321 (-),score=67.22 TRINITY_DN355_c0_g2_i1:140-1102(-)
MLDAGKSGTVDTADIKRKFNPQRHPAVIEGWKTEQQVTEEFETILNLFTETFDSAGKLSKEAFTSLYTCISASIDKDENFILLLKNTLNLDATAYNPSIPSSKPSTATSQGFNSESAQSPFKTSIAQMPESSLIKPTHEVPIEAPYYTEEEEKILGNEYEQVEGKTEALVLNRLREAISPREVRGVLGLERLFKIYGKEGLVTVDDVERAMGDFRIGVDRKDLEVIFKAMDTDGDGKVAYSELIKSIVGRMSEKRRQLVEKAFSAIDADSDGCITKEDINKSLDAVKHPEVRQGRKTREDILREITEQMELSKTLHVTAS